MTQSEYDSLTRVGLTSLTSMVDGLQDRTPRTLLYGYDTSRNTWHVYLDGVGALHKVVYAADNLKLHHESGRLEDTSLIPSKRLYPQHCDFEACALLVRAGISLPFTTWAAHPLDKRSPYAGHLAETLTMSTRVSAVWLMQLARKAAEHGDAEIGLALQAVPEMSSFAEAVAQLAAALRKLPPSDFTDTLTRVALAMEYAGSAAKLTACASSEAVAGFDVFAVRFLPTAELPQFAAELAKALAHDNLWEVSMGLFNSRSRVSRAEEALALLCDQLEVSPWSTALTLEPADVFVNGRVLLATFTVDPPLPANALPPLLPDGKTRIRYAEDGTTPLFVLQEKETNYWSFACALFGPALQLPKESKPEWLLFNLR